MIGILRVKQVSVLKSEITDVDTALTAALNCNNILEVHVDLVKFYLLMRIYV